MSDLCVCMRDVISEFNSEIVGSLAFCTVMLFLCYILCLMCSGSSLHVECILPFWMLGLSAWRMMFELLIMLEISRPLWSLVCETQSVECAFTSPVSIEFGMLVTCRMQYAMSVATVLLCGDVVSLGGKYAFVTVPPCLCSLSVCMVV